MDAIRLVRGRGEQIIVTREDGADIGSVATEWRSHIRATNRPTGDPLIELTVDASAAATGTVVLTVTDTQTAAVTEDITTGALDLSHQIAGVWLHVTGVDAVPVEFVDLPTVVV